MRVEHVQNHQEVDFMGKTVVLNLGKFDVEGEATCGREVGNCFSVGFNGTRFWGS